MKSAQKEILRRLVGEYMGYAVHPDQDKKKRLWKALNRGRMERPMVTVDQLPWDELVCEELTLQIENPYWRGVENWLRQTLYKWRRFPVDMVLDPFIPIPKALVHTGYGLRPEEKTIGTEDSTAKSYHFTNQLKSLEDTEKITDYHITHDKVKTAQNLEEAFCLFGDLAPAVPMGHTFHLGMWDIISGYMGVDSAYIAFMDNPELLHAAMERLTRATLCAIDDANACEGHNDNSNLCHCSYIYTDELLPDSGQGKGPYSENCWAFGLAQLFTSISPDMFEEYEFPYISRLAEKFGMLYYGCCDRLDDRLDIVKRIPHVRKVSCSPWSNRERFAAEIGPELIMSNKPSPVFLADDVFDEESVRKDLMYTCELAKANKVNLEFLLKDVSTVKKDPSRLTRWHDVAMQVVQSF